MIILVTRNRIFKKILRERDILKLWDEGFTRLTNVIRDMREAGFRICIKRGTSRKNEATNIVELGPQQKFTCIVLTILHF